MKIKSFITYILLLSFFLIFNIANAQTFHAIIIANTDDTEIGTSCLQDYKKMTLEMSAIASANSMSLKTYYLKGKNFTKQKAMDILSTLNCRDDYVFFYFTGHGGRAKNDKIIWPQLSFSTYDYIPLSKVDEIIKAKGAKLRIVMADCCNKIIGGLTPQQVSISKGNTIIKGSTESNYIKLFGKLKGNILVSSSLPGEISAGYDDTGGAFTYCMLNELQKVVIGLGGEISWKNLLNRTKTTTKNFIGHTPQFKIKVSDASYIPNNEIIIENDFIGSLISIADNNKKPMQRINMRSTVLNKYFANTMAKIEIIGKNSKTVVGTESAEDFIARLSTSRNLVNFVEIEAKRNSNGKITEIKIHEIYKF